MSTGGISTDSSPYRKRARYESVDENPQTSAQSTEGFSQLGRTNILHEPHYTIIRDNRRYLVENIDLMRTSVLDHLVQLQVLGQHQLEAFRDRYTTNLQLASALLDHLCRRPYSGWQTFLACLKDNNHGHVVDYLHDPQLGSCVDLDHLQEIMVRTIKAKNSEVDMFRWHENHEAVPMEEQYVDLVMLRHKKGTLGPLEEKLSSYKEIFKQKTGEWGTVYLTGEPGVGKTTFCKRMLVDWTKVRDGECRTSEELNLYNFMFVLPIYLRIVKSEWTLRDIFVEEYQIECKDAEYIFRHIEKNQQSTLFLCDGLDEYNEKTSQEITKLLHRKYLPYVKLLITSRHPSSVVFAKTKKPDIELVLKGFSTEGVEEYLEKFYKQRKEEGNALLSKIRETEELEHLSHYPSVLLMMATLWHFIPKFASTVTGFYLDYIRYLLGRYEEKYSLPRRSYTEILTVYNEQLMTIGELATSAMKNNKVELSFYFDEVIRQIGEETWKLGILIEETSFLGGRVVVFPHKTLQEFFVSFFIVNSPKSRQRELLMSFCGSRRAFAESAMIRKFVVGLGGKELHTQIETLIEGNAMQVARMHTDLQLEYLAEHRDARLKLPTGIMLVITDRYPASHYVRYLKQDGGEVRKVWVESGDEKTWRLLQHLHAPQLACLWLDGSGSTCSFNKKYITWPLDRTLLKFQLKQLTVVCPNDENAASAVVRAVIYTRTLQDLNFWRITLTGDRIQTLTEWLPRSQLASLTISNCYLTLQEMMAALSVLPPSLLSLNVKHINLTGLMDAVQLLGVTQSQIQTLNMTWCRLASRGVLAVINAAPETLTDLNLSQNCRFGEVDEMLSLTERTTRLKKLKTLNLEWNNISRDVVTTIKQELTETCPCLELVIDKQESW